VTKRGNLRASDADRDLTIDRLRKAATEGRIASEELEHRVTAALKALTYAELDATVADLPGPRRREQHPQRRSVPLWALSTVRSNPILLVLLIPVVAVTAALVLVATLVWSAVMIAFLILGGRRGVLGPPWMHAHRHHGLRPPRRGPGGYWA
jgi:hypothetical protein